MQSNKDSFKTMSRSKGERWKKYENLSILGQGIHVIETEVRRKSTEIFLFRRHHLKAELYRYIHIVIFGKRLSELYYMVLMCF